MARTIGEPYRQVLSAALFDANYLTEVDAATSRPYMEVLHDAVAVLTEAARLTNQPVRQTSSGQLEPDPDPRAAVPIDWAEFVTLALAGAAANVGSTAKILSGRPGSWEADRVGTTLESTVGVDDEHLLRHRTEPVTVASSAKVMPRGLGDTVWRIWITRSTVRCGRAGSMRDAGKPLQPCGLVPCCLKSRCARSLIR